MLKNDFTENTKKVLAERVGYLCSRCGRPTIGPHLENDKSLRLGEAAHIIAASETGPRADSSLSSKECRSIDNGIWLCCDCHTLIDKDKNFSIKDIRQLKIEAERTAYRKLLGQAVIDSLRITPEILNLIIKRFNEDIVISWEEAKADINDSDQLQYYIEPHFSFFKNGNPIDTSSHSLSNENISEINKYIQTSIPELDIDTELSFLLSHSQRICVTEDAGAGKSIFSRRIEAFLSSKKSQEKLLNDETFLIVRWEPRIYDWPTSFDQKGLIDVITILISKTVQSLGTSLSPSAIAESIINQKRIFFILDALDQVSKKESIYSLEQSIKKGIMKDFRLIITARAYSISEYPHLFNETNKWSFCRINGFNKQQQEEYLKGLFTKSLSELFEDYEEVEQLLSIPIVLALIRMLASKGKLTKFKSRSDLYLQVHEYYIKYAARKLGLNADSHSQMRWTEILSSIAFEMMEHEYYNYTLNDEYKIQDICEAASKRCNIPVSTEEWRTIESVSSLTNRSILEGANNECISWKHLSLMEFYCGLYLARYVQHDCIDKVHLHINDSHWYWVWRFAIEMPSRVWRTEIILKSLSQLFEKPNQGERPSELIFRSWDIIGKMQGGDFIIEKFEHEFVDIFNDPKHIQHYDAKNIIRQLKKCPSGIFTMGSTDYEGYVNEHPCHVILLDAFEIGQNPVSSKQYSLFDNSYFDHNNKSNKPLIVNWYQAWAFCRWLGPEYSLPTEAQWEYACRAGAQTSFCRILDKNTSTGWRDLDTDEYDNDLNLVALCNHKGANSINRLPNYWGLYDMLGNVWEWCNDWYNCYSNDREINPNGPSNGISCYGRKGSARVVRGGGIYAFSVNCRAAYRYGFEPEFISSDSGFRIVRNIENLPLKWPCINENLLERPHPKQLDLLKYQWRNAPFDCPPHWRGAPGP